MFTPQTYSIALLLMTLSMLCWGSWANTQKITRSWPFELYYFDYSLGLLAFALIIGLTLGQINPSSPDSFFLNLRAASPRSLLLAFAGGAVFSVGNILIVAAISVAGMAVAFPIGAGLALVLGAVLNYVVSPAGNPVLIFSGNRAGVYRDCPGCFGLQGYLARWCGIGKRHSSEFRRRDWRRALLSSGGQIGGWPGPSATLYGERRLCPGAAASALPMIYLLLRRPISGPPLELKDYGKGTWNVHAQGNCWWAYLGCGHHR